MAKVVDLEEMPREALVGMRLVVLVAMRLVVLVAMRLVVLAGVHRGPMQPHGVMMTTHGRMITQQCTN